MNVVDCLLEADDFLILLLDCLLDADDCLVLPIVSSVQGRKSAREVLVLSAVARAEDLRVVAVRVDKEGLVSGCESGLLATDDAAEDASRRAAARAKKSLKVVNEEDNRKRQPECHREEIDPHWLGGRRSGWHSGRRSYQSLTAESLHHRFQLFFKIIIIVDEAPEPRGVEKAAVENAVKRSARRRRLSCIWC